MIYTREQIQSAYKRLPPEIHDLIMDNETMDLIANALEEAGLNEEQAALADSEILDAMYCLQSLDDAINNIAKLSNKNPNDLSKIRLVIQDNILNKYKIDIKDFIETNKTSKISTPEIPPANLPMVEEGEVAHEVPHVESTINPPPPKATEGQSNQQSTINQEQAKVSLPDYRYEGGKDPYREPLK